MSQQPSRKEELNALQHVEESGKDTSDTNFDHTATTKLLRKCDLALLPPLMSIYFLSFMDRTNIGEYDFL
jgi:hypothetical protein